MIDWPFRFDPSPEYCDLLFFVSSFLLLKLIFIQSPAKRCMAVGDFFGLILWLQVGFLVETQSSLHFKYHHFLSIQSCSKNWVVRVLICLNLYTFRNSLIPGKIKFSNSLTAVICVYLCMQICERRHRQRQWLFPNYTGNMLETLSLTIRVLQFLDILMPIS